MATTKADAEPTAPATEAPRLAQSDLDLIDAVSGVAQAEKALRRLPEDHSARAYLPLAQALVSGLAAEPIGPAADADTSPGGTA